MLVTLIGLSRHSFELLTYDCYVFEKYVCACCRQIRGHVEQMGFNVSSCGNDMLEYRRCLAASFFLKAAQRQMDGTYRALESGEIVHIHPTSVLFRSKPECVIFNELMQTSKKYIKNLTRIDHLWLAEFAPHHYKTDDEMKDLTQGKTITDIYSQWLLIFVT